eukprot:47991-Chlamydomonas_euryale.AAC.1
MPGGQRVVVPLFKYVGYVVQHDCSSDPAASRRLSAAAASFRRLQPLLRKIGVDAPHTATALQH